jgi:Tol biopolymer transport system component
VARRLDVATRTLTGEPVTVADRLLLSVTSAAKGAVSSSRGGLLAYRTGIGTRRQLTWFDRSGKVLGTFGEPDTTRIAGPRLSPDGRRVVLWRRVQNNGDIWVLDGVRASRLTVDPGVDHWPLWSPDGSKVAFRSMRAGRVALYQKLAGGSSVEEQLVVEQEAGTPTSWSRDGRWMLSYSTPATDVGWDMWLWDMDKPGPPAAFLKTRFNERWGAFSPDGRWVAYQSNESGRTEVYVRPFTPPGAAVPAVADAQWQVSIDGGLFPAWRPDGRELYYLDPGGAMMAASIAVTGSSLQPGTPIRLFSPRIVGAAADSEANRQYDIAPDGRFLINIQLDDDAGPITVVQNWRPPAQ